MAFDINKLLVDVNQYFNSQFEGYEQAFTAELDEGNDNACRFILTCQKLVSNHLDVDNLDTSNFTEDSQTFFEQVLKKFLKNPSQRFFKNDNTITGHDDPIIVYYTKLKLIKSLFNSCIDNFESLQQAIASNPLWFENSRKTLLRGFKNLPNHLFNGIQVNSLKDLDKKITKAKTNVRHYTTTTRPLLYVGVLFYIFYYLIYKDGYLDFMGRGNYLILIAFTSVFIYIRYLQDSAWTAHARLQHLTDAHVIVNARSSVIGENALSRPEIRKIFLLMPEDIDELNEKLAALSNSEMGPSELVT